jgi:hypothetical protein
VIAGVHIFDTIAASLSNILIRTSTCGSVRYKRKIQNRKIPYSIQSKRVLGLIIHTSAIGSLVNPFCVFVYYICVQAREQRKH